MNTPREEIERIINFLFFIWNNSFYFYTTWCKKCT